MGEIGKLFRGKIIFNIDDSEGVGIGNIFQIVLKSFLRFRRKERGDQGMYGHLYDGNLHTSFPQFTDQINKSFTLPWGTVLKPEDGSNSGIGQSCFQLQYTLIYSKKVG